MEEEENIRKKLNLTQDDMAMILNISRSQWSLYELGFRHLSTDAEIRLSQIERFFLSDEVSISRYSNKMEAQEQIKSQFFTDQLKENEFRLEGCQRKLDRLKKEYEAISKQFQLIDFLSKPTDEKYALHLGALQTLIDKAEEGLTKNGPPQILNLEWQEQKLQQEALLLTLLLKESVAKL
ncbi:helix-turn-helix domain-containing protein [Flavobacterium sp. 25HG05S-40]|uniref:helix-turn-helix domain-containing protein n=1 Tax=Flavobacterium sp. 25HG05S-40 TaxID=3458682 RepID=UPI004043C1D5